MGRLLREILLIISMISIVLSGCNQTQSNQVDEENNQDLTTIKVIAESPEAISLFRMEETAIKEKFGIQLEYNYPERITDRLEDYLFLTENTYDIYCIFPAKIPLYVERDMLVPLDSYIANNPSLEKDIIPIYRELYMNYGNHDYGMVYDGDTHLLFYRKDLFERFNEEYKMIYGHDLTPPSTWEEYARISKFLTRDLDNDGKIDIYGTATLNADAKRYIWFAERFLSMGGEYFDENMTPLIHSRFGIQAVRDQLALEDSGATPPQSMYDWVDLNNAFFQGKVAMVIQFSDTARFSFDKETWNSTIPNKVGWSLVPGASPDSPTGGAWIGRVLSISKDSTVPDKAWQVIQYITSLEASKHAINSYETINDPYLIDHLEPIGNGPFPDQHTNKHFLQTVSDSLKNTNSDLMIPGGWDYMQILDKHLGQALIHKLTPEEALKETTIEWEALTEKYGRENQKKYYQEWLEKLQKVRNANEKQ